MDDDLKWEVDESFDEDELLLSTDPAVKQEVQIYLKRMEEQNDVNYSQDNIIIDPEGDGNYMCSVFKSNQDYRPSCHIIVFITFFTFRLQARRTPSGRVRPVTASLST